MSRAHTAGLPALAPGSDHLGQGAGERARLTGRAGDEAPVGVPSRVYLMSWTPGGVKLVVPEFPGPTFTPAGTTSALK